MGRKRDNAENNSPDNVEKVGKLKKKIIRAEQLYLIANALITLLLAVFSVKDMFADGSLGAIQYVVIALITAYIVAFVTLIALFSGNSSELKRNLKNYKFAVKIMKGVIGIINPIMALIVLFEGLESSVGASKIFAVIVGILGVALAVVKLLSKIVKFARKKKKEKKKILKKEERQLRKEQRKLIADKSAVEEITSTDEEGEK